jgi:hypothetical protein
MGQTFREFDRLGTKYIGMNQKKRNPERMTQVYLFPNELVKYLLRQRGIAGFARPSRFLKGTKRRRALP